MSLILSLPSFMTMSVGDKLKHSIFGDIRLDMIYREFGENPNECLIACTLLEFNDTIRVFKGTDLHNMKYGIKVNLRIVK